MRDGWPAVASRDTAPLAHVLVRDRAEDREFRRIGGGDPKIRDVESRAHGQALRQELSGGIKAAESRRGVLPPTLEELQAIGVVIVLEGADPAYPLKLDSLERISAHTKQPKRPLWLLLSVTPATEDHPERAMVWVSDEYRARFLKLFENYLKKTTPNGHPQNRELIANIGRIRAAVLADLWQSAGAPPATGQWWWELWLAPSDAAVELARQYVQARGLEMADRFLVLNERTVVWIRASWADLEDLPFTSVPLTEVRRPELAETIEDLSPEDQDELTEDLVGRIEPTEDPSAPVICHLDTGVRRTHALLSGSLAATDVHTIVGSFDDRQNHGTPMAGLSLLGPLDELLLDSRQIVLRHRLESVKILPDTGPGHDPRAYGLLTAQAVALPEATATRPRAFCLPSTAEPDLPGQPSLWSASIDALAAGIDIAADGDGIALLGAPNANAARLFVVSAGNVAANEFEADYRARCDLSTIEDPAHAWNALTVGAHTELTSAPSDPSFLGWLALAESGDISPHSRTSLTFSSRTWPIKPDICMEGGNVLFDGASDFVGDHPVVSVRTADARDDLALGSANATSAATAQAARLAALASASYPAFWPETVRGLLVHAAEWTPVMRAEVDGANSKAQRLALLRRYGWGVPTEDSVLNSTRQAVTMVTQDEFIPFDGEKHLARHFRLHRLPWPVEVLRTLAATDVTLKVTLSYFIEPTASRRGWRRRYSYPSHGLRFELKGPTETLEDFLARVNREARAEEEGSVPSGSSGRWLIGPYQRNLGSLHQDLWEGSGAELAEAGFVAVHPVGGWWKYAKRADRINHPVRYALLISLKTTEQGVDLYTPIATQLELPIPVEIPAT
jgi:Subtilase family